MRIKCKFLFLLISIFVIVGLASQSFSQTVQVERAEKPIPFPGPSAGDAPPEISAVEFIDNAGVLLLTADDENKKLAIVKSSGGETTLVKLRDFPDGKPKFEGLARDELGIFYVLGGHAVKAGETDPKKLKVRSSIFRFELSSMGTDPSAIKIDPTKVVELDIKEALKSFGYSAVIAENKVKLEGLAIRAIKGAGNSESSRELFVGLREPGSPVRILVFDITNSAKTTFSKSDIKQVITFDAGKSENVDFLLSSIEYIPEWNGFVILTSTENPADSSFHGNALWFLPEKQIAPVDGKPSEPIKVNPQRVWLFEKNMKAEGITVLPANGNTGTLQAFIVYDNDNKTPSQLQRITLARWPD
jgi:hypothetical protein